MDTIKQATEFIQASLDILDEQDKKGLAYQGLSALEVIDNATSVAGDHAGKNALLKVWSINEANRIASFVWRKGLMTEELEKTYRGLPTLDESGKDYENYSAERKVLADELEEKRKVFSDEDREMQLFQAVLSGISKEKAEEEMAAYQKRAQQAIGA